MSEPRPRLINPEELGISNSQGLLETSAGSVYPTVLRYGGRVRWMLQNNTTEENEQLGISNVQGLFLENFPEFKMLFPLNEEGTIEDGRQRDAAQYILDRTKGEKFNEIFTGSPINAKHVSYFHGSKREVLMKSFKPWGIHFNVKDFNLPRGFWNKQSKEETIAVILSVFLEQFPQVREILEKRDPINKSTENELKKLILANLGTREKFIEVFSNYLLTREKFPYLGGSHKTALVKIFEQWGVTFDREDFVISGKVIALEQGTHKTKNYWTLDNIKTEIEQFLQSGGTITNLRQQRRDLSRAIERNYPGGYRQFISDQTGTELKKYIKPSYEEMEQMAGEIFTKKGRLSKHLLGNIYYHIEKRYPGGFAGMKEKLGVLPTSETIVSPEEANRIIGELVQELERQDPNL